MGTSELGFQSVLTAGNHHYIHHNPLFKKKKKTESILKISLALFKDSRIGQHAIYQIRKELPGTGQHKKSRQKGAGPRKIY